MAGYFTPGAAADPEWIRKMTDCLRHRGPDAEGFYKDRDVAFGHRRLSIIDLSDAARQPMVSRDERWVMMFNGEVYNYRQLAATLGGAFRSHSDTEVMLESFAHHGAGAVQQFNGMFAIALFDRKNRQLHLFRDRAGVKPLFLMRANGRIFFASELKSFLELPERERPLSPNFQALSLYLQLGYIPEPHTIWNEIQKFPAGHHAQVTAAGIEMKRYWIPEEPSHSPYVESGSEVLNTFRKLLDDSVQLRMISDVPYGTFLSGGIDSSLISAIAARHTNSLNTFTIGFSEKSHDESPHAEKIAAYLKTNHHQLRISEADVLQHAEEALDLFDEPFADSSAIPTMLVSKLARREVKMILTGDGGDELFMGYGSYRWAERLSKPWVKTIRAPAAAILSQLPRFRKAAEILKSVPESQAHQHLFTAEQGFFPQRQAAALLDRFFTDGSLPLPPEGNKKRAPAERQSMFDLKYYLCDDLLVKVDRASMHYGLECRTPLLDYRILEFASQLSQTWKMSGKKRKILPRILLEEYLPRSLFERPKQGFSIPLAKWLRQELRFLPETYLSIQAVQDAGLLNPSLVDQIVRKFREGNDYAANQVWNLVALQRWVMKYRLKIR